ncbi:hypothetical protein CXB51_008483 [Gossypium anomalum]|uniref:DUF7745 domain-containing protein n=1 Tax=Gossypium anomalum TaxID=47600 RepID=A0A8J5ZK64_9ROSI|nr:hypothetical protein CXB51_008483 [Gossypium anomalum]
MPNLRLFSSHQNKCTGGTPLTFCTFTFYTRGLGLFNKLDRVVRFVAFSMHHIRKVLTKDRLPKNGFLMEESTIQTTEKNAVVRDWSLKTQKEKWDSLVEGCIANLPEYVTVNVRQNNLEDLEDMTPTIEKYAALFRVNNVQPYKIYVKEPKPMTFKKKLMRLTDMTDTWAEKQIKKKNETICIPWSSLRDLVLNHPDMIKRVNLFALAIYGLVIFPKVLGHLEVAVVDFFERLKQGINPVSTILAETFRSLSSCRRKGEGRFIGCAQLLNVWILSHFWKVERTSFHMFSKTFSPLEAYLKKEWPKEVTEQHWVSVFQNLRAEDIMWRDALQFYYTGSEIKTGCHYSDYGEELDMPHY